MLLRRRIGMGVYANGRYLGRARLSIKVHYALEVSFGWLSDRIR